MPRKQSAPSLYLLLCWILESHCVQRTHPATDDLIPSWKLAAEAMCVDPLSQTNLFACHARRKRSHPTSIADKINAIKGTTSSTNQRRNRDSTTPPIVFKESEKIVFSRKYSPVTGMTDDGFIPVPGPYGFKSRFDLKRALTSPVEDGHKAEPAGRSLGSSRHKAEPAGRSLGSSRHNLRHTPSSSVQRRAQYRFSKLQEEDLDVEDSLSSENVLGNGNFEIIRGGIFSDQDANEIIGSRRMGRGYGSYTATPYRPIQNQFFTTRNVQFPAYYQGSVQNPLRPLFYPRAPY